MPNSELGLADIHERLRSLCRRVNGFTALHASAVCLAVLLGCLALRTALGPRRFGPAPIGLCLAACLAAGGWAMWFIRRRWLRPADAARLADRQAELGERLTTLSTLGDRTTGNRLLPLLLSQTIELRGRWQPELVHPRAYPRSIYVAVAALLATLASPLIEPILPPPLYPEAADVPPDTAGDRGDSAAALQMAALTEERPEGIDRDEGGGAAAQAGADSQSQATRDASLRGKVSDTKPAAGARATAQVQGAPASLRGTEVDGGESTMAPGDGRSGASGDDTERAPSGAERDDRRGAARDPARQQEGAGREDSPEPQGGEIPPDPRSAAAHGAAEAPAHGKPTKATEKDPPQDPSRGGAADASGGTQKLTLGANADPEGPAVGSFKLTLSSFLDEIEQRNGAPEQTPAPPRGAAPERPPRALAERTAHDDVVVQTSIPAPYEEIVKRVYSRSQRP